MVDDATGWTGGRIIPDGPGRGLDTGTVFDTVFVILLVVRRELPERGVFGTRDILFYIHKQHFLYTAKMQQVTRRQVAIPPYTASSIFKSTKWRRCNRDLKGSADTKRGD